MAVHATSGLVSMSLLFFMSAARSMAEDAADPRSPEALFDRARRVAGRDYREARASLLALGLPASSFLEAKAADAGASPEDRWLAAILLDRSNHPETYAHLEAVFAEKVFAAEFGGPRITASGRPPKAILFEPGHEVIRPKGLAGPRPFEDQFLRWDKTLALPESASWRPFLGEILLKGWVVEDAEKPGKLGREVLTPDDFLRQAIHLLGRLGEDRAGPALLKILREENRPDSQRREETWLGLRPQAAEALGRLKYGPALDTLLELAEDRKTSVALVAAAFPAIRRIGDRRAFPVLGRIADRPFVPNDGKTYNFNAINAGTTAASQTLRILRGEEKAPED